MIATRAGYATFQDSLKGLPMGSIARFAAVLRGTDVIAGCVMETWQERSSTDRVFIRARIVECSADLPDGKYTIEFAGHTIQVRRWGEKWSLTYLPSEIQIHGANVEFNTRIAEKRALA